MGRCRVCGAYTKVPHNNYWCLRCLYFDFRSLRFWLSAVVTAIVNMIPLPNLDIMVLEIFVRLFQPKLMFVVVILSLVMLLLSFIGISRAIYYILKGVGLHTYRFGESKNRSEGVNF